MGTAISGSCKTDTRAPYRPATQPTAYCPGKSCPLSIQAGHAETANTLPKQDRSLMSMMIPPNHRLHPFQTHWTVTLMPMCQAQCKGLLHADSAVTIFTPTTKGGLPSILHYWQQNQHYGHSASWLSQLTPSSQSVHQAHCLSILQVVGETHFSFTCEGHKFTFEGLVENLDIDILADTPFMEVKDIVTGPFSGMVLSFC